MDHNRKALSMWEWWSKARSGIPVYDPWLDTYERDLKKAGKSVVLDLGCGTGADTQYLVERGYNVLAADYSRSALRSIQKYIGCGTEYVDMNDRFPFPGEHFQVIVADMSLHYFSNEKTVHVMNEIRRVLAPGGVLLARVSSINDTAYGAGSGRELEPRFYDHGGYAQRYLDEQDVKRYFELVGKVTFRETGMTRSRDSYYSYPKRMYEVRAQKGQKLAAE